MSYEASELRVGDLAQASGLTVRALHHYHEIGLLVASTRSAGGHRLYAPGDVERLYRIRLLRQLGVPLAAIGRMLDDPGWDLRGAMARHLGDLEDRVTAASRLRGRLARVVAALDSSEPLPAPTLTKILEEMVMTETTIQRGISIAVYADISAAHAFLVDAFGLVAGPLTRDPEGVVVHGEVEAGDGVIWLHPESAQYGMVSPRTAGGTTGSIVVIVDGIDDVDAHHRHAAERGAEIVYPPVDQPYGYREYSARDPEGGLWSFMAPLD